MKKKYIVMSIFIAIVISCGKDQKLIDAEDTTVKFFKSINENNQESMQSCFPAISTFGNYYKSDSIKVLGSKFINDSLVQVSTKNFFTNGFGKKNEQKIELFLLSDSLGVYSRIVDSKGLTDYQDNEQYQFGRKTGCIKQSDTTDVKINIKILDADLLSYSLTLDKLLEFKRNVSVVDWSWETGYGGSASGKAIVKNNTSFDIPKVKYKISYKDRSGNEITSDDGYVTYDVLKAGGSESFTFYTSYVGSRASRASISLEFDEGIIKDYVLNADYNGDEYEKFITERR